MAIDLVRMPPEMSRGFASILNWGNRAVYGGNFGKREVVRVREQPARRWQATKGVFKRERIEELSGFLLARFGMFHAFRFWDARDHSTNPTSWIGAPTPLDQFLGYGDGVRTEFGLRRMYASTAADLPQRRFVEDRMLWIHNETDDRLAKCIGLPTSTLFLARFAVNSGETTAFTINHRNRSVVFDTPPALSSVVTGGAYYDWPASLGEDGDANFETLADSWTAQTAPNLPIECEPFETFAPETDDPGGAKSLTWGAGRPILSKAEAKFWRLAPAASGLSVALQEPSGLNAGGPHFVVLNDGPHSVDVRDELSGSVISAVGANETCWFMVEIQGSTRNWFFTRT